MLRDPRLDDRWQKIENFRSCLGHLEERDRIPLNKRNFNRSDFCSFYSKGGHNEKDSGMYLLLEIIDNQRQGLETQGKSYMLLTRRP